MGLWEDFTSSVETTVKDTVKTIVAPAEAALDIAKGDNKSAGERFVKAAGTIGDAATMGTSKFLSTEQAQQAIRRTGWNDFAGFHSAINQARTEGTVSNQYRDEALRFTSQAGAIGLGSLAYSNQVIPIGDGMYASGKEIATGFSVPLPSATEAYLGYQLVKSGKNADAFEQLTGVQLPDWLKDIIPSVPSDPAEFAPWRNPTKSTDSSSYTGNQQDNPTMKILLFGAGAIALILILKKVVKK